MKLQSSDRWYADRAAWRLIGLRYLPWLAGLSLAWELAQMPLYTLWSEGSPAFIAFSVVHCTLGDAAIGTTALAVALIVTRAPALAGWRWGRIAVVTALAGAGYTAFSEWQNVYQTGSWSYAPAMPLLFGIGVAPLLQWLVIPPLGIAFLRRHWIAP